MKRSSVEVKKILMLCDYYGIGQTYQENLLAKYYVSFGIEVVIIASTTENVVDFVNDHYDKSKEKSIVHDGRIKIIRLPYKLNILNKIRSFPGVGKILEDEKPDLVFAHDIYFNLSEAVKYKLKYGKILIMDYHADFSNSGKNWISINILHKIIRKTYFKRLQKHIDKIYPVVPESARFLNEIYDVSYDCMEVLPLGYDSEQMEKIRRTIERSSIRNSLGIRGDDFVIINGGKFNQDKKTHLTIETLKELNNNKVHLLIFGKSGKDLSSYEDELRKSAENLNVHFLGWISAEEVSKYMLISDLAMFPASQSVLWQQSIGAFLPLIAGDVGQQDMSYLNQNDNLIKVDKENINAKFFASLINELIVDETKYNRMKDGAKKTALEYLDYRLITKKTLEN